MPKTKNTAPAGSAADVMARLAAVFDPSEVKFKPAVVSGNRAMALAYVDARVIQDRLDEVLGCLGWQDAYKVLDGGSVVCRLRLLLDGSWVTKMDVGSPSEQSDAGDRLKAAFSDALKRTAVKFGIGRYLYRLPSQWVDYDPQKRQFTRPPTLPAWALPAAKPAAATAAPAGSAAETTARPAATKLEPPRTGAEFERWVEENDRAGAAKDPPYWRPGYLIEWVLWKAAEDHLPKELAAWDEATVARYREATVAQAKAVIKKVKGKAAHGSQRTNPAA